jgi:hypothetical protein
MLWAGYFNLFTSLGLLVIYVVYVALVVVQSKSPKDDKTKEADQAANHFVSIAML